MTDLATSYARCQRLARRAASNFYFSFRLLPPPQRAAMYSLYAYLRRVDDLGDDDTRDIATRQRALGDLRESLYDAIDGNMRDDYLPALADTVHTYGIPVELLTATIDGVLMDLAGTRYEDFAALEEYCYRVASVVGMSCIYIWGFTDVNALDYARKYGVAFQLTNILRDLAEDATRGRLYLPADELRASGYTAAELERGEINGRFLRLMSLQIARAESYYDQAAPLVKLLHPPSRRVLVAMTCTYRKLLEKIKHNPAAVLQRRVRLSWWEKARIAGHALLLRQSSVDV